MVRARVDRRLVEAMRVYIFERFDVFLLIGPAPSDQIADHMLVGSADPANWLLVACLHESGLVLLDVKAEYCDKHSHQLGSIYLKAFMLDLCFGDAMCLSHLFQGLGQDGVVLMEASDGALGVLCDLEEGLNVMASCYQFHKLLFLQHLVDPL
jgi:hypothetical protein